MSDLRSETSRRNGAKSNGPTTPKGKLRSSFNRLKHGRYSKYFDLVQPEDREAHDQLTREYITRYRPADPVDLRLVLQLVSLEWRKQRLDALDTIILDQEYAIQTAAILAADKNHSPDTITAFSTNNLVERSRLTTFLGSRSAQLVRERDAILRLLEMNRKLYPITESWSDLESGQELTPDSPAGFEPESNSPAEPPAPQTPSLPEESSLVQHTPSCLAAAVEPTTSPENPSAFEPPTPPKVIKLILVTAHAGTFPPELIPPDPTTVEPAA